MSGGAASRGRTFASLALLIAVVAAANVARSAVIPGRAQPAFNLALAALALVIGGFAGMTLGELGLDRDHLGSGLRYGAAAFALVGSVLLVAALIPALSGAFDDDRAEIGLGAMLLKVLVTIPIGTVLVEELIFRGVLLGLLRRIAATVLAVAVASVLFGLWHVYPAWRAASENAALEALGRTGSISGTFLATTAAGVAFSWLRVRSGSLVAPVLAHVATNSTSFAAAWVLAR